MEFPQSSKTFVIRSFFCKKTAPYSCFWAGQTRKNPFASKLVTDFYAFDPGIILHIHLPKYRNLRFLHNIPYDNRRAGSTFL